jgi:hypothetical protein
MAEQINVTKFWITVKPSQIPLPSLRQAMVSQEMVFNSEVRRSLLEPHNTVRCIKLYLKPVVWFKPKINFENVLP